jgi:hypothetical protein
MGHGDPQKILIYGPLGSYPQPPPWYRFWQLAAYAAALRQAHEDKLSLIYSMIGVPDTVIDMPVVSYDAAKVAGLTKLAVVYSTNNSGYFATIEDAPTP